jgi:hypothetical protein
VREEVALVQVLSQFEQDTAAKERLQRVHSRVLDIEIPEGPLKIFMSNFPPLLTPLGPKRQTAELEGVPFSFEEWKLKY